MFFHAITGLVQSHNGMTILWFSKWVVANFHFSRNFSEEREAGRKMVDYVISRTPQRYVISPRCDLTVWHVLHPPTLYTLGFAKSVLIWHTCEKSMKPGHDWARHKRPVWDQVSVTYINRLQLNAQRELGCGKYETSLYILHVALLTFFLKCW